MKITSIYIYKRSPNLIISRCLKLPTINPLFKVSLSGIKLEKLITLRQNTSTDQKTIKTEKYNHTMGKDSQ